VEQVKILSHSAISQWNRHIAKHKFSWSTCWKHC